MNFSKLDWRDDAFAPRSLRPRSAHGL